MKKIQSPFALEITVTYLSTTINASGGSATEGPNTGGIGRAGGFDGGLPDVNGQGPGAGKAKSVVSGSNEQGGGAAYGGTGYETDSSFSQTYGSADLINHLLGGSMVVVVTSILARGAGGGAIELFAHTGGRSINYYHKW